MSNRGILRYAQRGLRALLLADNEPNWLRVHHRRTYIRNAIIASPDWLDREWMRAFIRGAEQLETDTGIRHVCDHIVPLTHPYVCGLNVPWNIQIIPWRVNAGKTNDFHPDQLELDLCSP